MQMQVLSYKTVRRKRKCYTNSTIINERQIIKRKKEIILFK